MGLSTEDRLEIQELFARYAFAADWHDAGAYADCFTEDGIFMGSSVRRGRQELMAAQRGGGTGQFASVRPRHFFTNFVMDGAGDAATVKCYKMLYNLTTEGPKPLFTCIYNCKVAMVNGQWKFKEMQLLFDRVL